MIEPLPFLQAHGLFRKHPHKTAWWPWAKVFLQAANARWKFFCKNTFLYFPS